MNGLLLRNVSMHLQDTIAKTLKLLLVLLFIFGLTACSINTKKDYDSKRVVQYEISKLTDISLDTSKFVVLADSVHYTEGAFDMDYTWHVNIHFERSYFEELKQTIRTSGNYNTVTHEYDEGWSSADTSKIKGAWYSESTFLKFVQKPTTFNPEPIALSIDTASKMLYLKLIHL